MEDVVGKIEFGPKEKFWRVTRQEVGTELGNPNYVRWVDKENARLRAERDRYREALEGIDSYGAVLTGEDAHQMKDIAGRALKGE